MNFEQEQWKNVEINGEKCEMLRMNDEKSRLCSCTWSVWAENIRNKGNDQKLINFFTGNLKIFEVGNFFPFCAVVNFP